MPTLPEGTNWDLEAPGSRFSLRPALGLPTPEAEWPIPATDDAWAEIVRRKYGDRLLDEEDPTLGSPALVRSQIGRGASAEMIAIEWLVIPIVKGVIAWIGVEAAKRSWRRARSGNEKESEAQAGPRTVLVNRGTAILLAAAAVKETFGVEHSLS